MFPLAVIPLAAAAGGSMSKGGGGSNAAADMQARIAQDMFQQTDPLRQQLLQRSKDYLIGGIDNSPVFSAFKAQAEPQFAQARDSVIESTPAGGGLIAALAKLEGDRARTLTQARGSIDEAELSRAITLGTGATDTAMSGLGSAASIQAAMAQSEAEREAGLLGALGTGAGAYFGSKDR